MIEINEAARQMGRKGGKSQSAAKKAASRENGEKGGRPKMIKHTIETLKGSFTGSLVECMVWQAENQGAMPSIDGIDISEMHIALENDAERERDDLTPEQAAKEFKKLYL